MEVEYRSIRFQGKTLLRIDQANEILDEYAAQGFTMTLRQLYYQFVARGLSWDFWRSSGSMSKKLPAVKKSPRKK
jgi:hypothetical protein